MIDPFDQLNDGWKTTIHTPYQFDGKWVSEISNDEGTGYSFHETLEECKQAAIDMVTAMFDGYAEELAKP